MNKKLLLSEIVDAISLEDALNNTISKSLKSVVDWINSVSDKQLQKKYKIKDRNVLGNGHAGIVFQSTNPEQVIKVTPISSDYEISSHVSGISNSLPKVIHKQKVQTENGGCLYLLTFPKLHPLDEETSELLSTLKEKWQKRHDQNYQSYDLERSKQRYEIIRNYYRHEKDNLTKTQKKTIIQLLKLIRSLHKRNIAFNDFKKEQFMSSDPSGSELTLADLGCLRKM